MKVKVILATLAATLGVTFALPALAHGDAKNVDKGADESKHDDQAAMLGKPGDPAKISRTIEMEMNDAMRFKPANITVKQGETIKFVVKNVGKVKHEMVLGSMKELKEHAQLMRKFPEMEHADPNQVTVEPGQTGDMVWQFTKAGSFDFACLQPGHFEAGMKGKVAVKR